MKVLSLILALLMVLPLSIMAGAAPASVSSPLEDLEKCEGFIQDDYPAREGDHSLQVIHVAETVADQVLLYVYAPGEEVVATSAVISLTDEGKEIDFNKYGLTLRAKEGVFQKYIVNGLTVSDEIIRSYEVASILRPWDEKKDAAPTDDNTIHEVAFEVGRMWTYGSDNGQYEVTQRNVITVTKKHVGFVRYNVKLFGADKDSHYIAFSTDKKIDKLLSVDVSYKTADMVYEVRSDGSLKPQALGDTGEGKVTLTDEQVFGQSGLFGSYEYDRIQRKKDFIKGENLTDTTKAALLGMEWVLRFLESPYRIAGSQLDCTDVTEVLLLRMEFEADGELYNMGVVDDVTSGDSIPDNKTLPDWFWIVVIILAILIVIAIFKRGLGLLVDAILWILVLPFKILWWLLKALGKGIAALFRKS